MVNKRSLKDLIDEGKVEVARLPDKNDYLIDAQGNTDLSRLDDLKGYTVPLISHDYGAKTPLMWNSLYERLGLKIRNIMVVADPSRAQEILEVLKDDVKYLGGGFGVGWKEKGIPYLDEVAPSDLKSVNIVVKESETGRLLGYNTDAQGLLRSVEYKLEEIGKGNIGGKNVVLLGSGGVSKEISRLLARRGAHYLAILNRTAPKAVEIAYELNKDSPDSSDFVAVGAGEEIIRGYLLNSFVVPDVVINTTDKGSDGPLEEYSAFAKADLSSKDGKGFSQTVSRTIAREMKRLNPEIVIADIVIPKKGKSITLRIAENEGLENLVNGIPMVVNQAAPAYHLIQEQNPDIHVRKVSEEEALDIFRSVTK